MTSLISKIEQLIKREKITPERKLKDDSNKSSSEILSELFSAFNADPPKIDEISVKKSKKSKKKHKKEKKKRSRSHSSSSNSDDSSHSHKKKKRKKKSKKHSKDRDKSLSHKRSTTPVKIKHDLEALVKHESDCIKTTQDIKIKKEPDVTIEHKNKVSIKTEDSSSFTFIDASQIPMPDSPKDTKLQSDDLRFKLESKKVETASGDCDKSKGKIQIKNLKFSTVFEETVKKAEEEARRRKERHEDGEISASSSGSERELDKNSQFPKSADPGGILKAAEEKLSEEEREKHSKKNKHAERKSSRKDKSPSRKRSSSRSRRRSRSGSTSRRRHSSHHSRSKHRSRSRSRHRSRSRRRSRSHHRDRPRHSPVRFRARRSRSRSASRVKLADHEKKRLLEVARKNAINMLKNGAVPAGAAALPPHTRNQVMAAIQSGGKSVDELTDFCKHLSKKEALGELSSVSSHDENSEDEDTRAFHHPFLVKDKGPIVMNIRGGVPLPTKAVTGPVMNKDELRIAFPVSSGTQHRDTEWVPVSPKKDNMQLATLTSSSKSAPKPAPKEKSAPLALPAPPTKTPDPPPYMKSFTSGTSSTLATVPALPAPGPQAYPPGVDPPKIDMASIVSQKLLMIRKQQEENELADTHGFGWTKDKKLGQFTGTTGVNILTPRELASGTQAWAKKDQLTRAVPADCTTGMRLLQKMGWTPGQGLGKEGTGTLQPLLLEVKLDTKGLQAKEEAPGRHNKGKGRLAGRRGGAGGGGGGAGAGAAAPLVAGGKHPVSLLGEYCSKQKLGPPEYTLCFECGPDHKKNFLFKVKVAGTEYQPAVASANKKQAKADAAQLALHKLGIVTN